MATDAAMALCVALTEMVRNGSDATESVPFDMFDERPLGIDRVRLRHQTPQRQEEIRALVAAGRPEPLPMPPDFEPDVRARMSADQRRLSDAMSLGLGEG